MGCWDALKFRDDLQPRNLLDHSFAGFTSGSPGLMNLHPNLEIILFTLSKVNKCAWLDGPSTLEHFAYLRIGANIQSIIHRNTFAKSIQSHTLPSDNNSDRVTFAEK